MKFISTRKFSFQLVNSNALDKFTRRNVYVKHELIIVNVPVTIARAGELKLKFMSLSVLNISPSASSLLDDFLLLLK